MCKPIIAIPIGDPAGIGPEIVVKALNHEDIYKVCKPLVIGDYDVILRACEICSLQLNIQRINNVNEGIFKHGNIDMIDLGNIDITKLEYGVEQAMCGQAAFDYIEKSIKLAMSKEVTAVATSTINKKSLKKANIGYIGHTEIFAGLTNTHDPLTMFEVKGMRVFFLSRHVSLKEACDMVTKERVLDYIKRCNEALVQMGITEGTMAIAGLNPHSGEGGLFGYEEVDAIIPAIKEAQQKGYRVEGPIGSDSVFHLALQGRYNSVLSMYHDQGHIATKTLDFERTIAITNGLPFLRTSVDHGTAFDIAGKGIASETSMKEAILLAAKYSPYFNER